MSIDTKLKITEIQRFCMHDGPGIRTTVFLKGCPLRCAWCHNPETQSARAELLFYADKCIRCAVCESICARGAHELKTAHRLDRTKCIACFRCVPNCPTNALEICGKEISAEEIISIVQKDAAFYGSVGGITLSGGEPFYQKDATIALLKACKSLGISTAVETCGYAEESVLRAAAPFVDLFLWDLKDTDAERHKKYTGVSNEKILRNLKMIDKLGARTRLSCILVNGINTDLRHYEEIARIANALRNTAGVSLIPYHAFGGTKATFLGECDNGNSDFIPDKEQVKNAKIFLKSKNVNVIN